MIKKEVSQALVLQTPFIYRIPFNCVFLVELNSLFDAYYLNLSEFSFPLILFIKIGYF